ncbi:hypothetical protein [Falsiroseomonas tokyonensis]|uniref:Uncharacterized protein n=1 Tax=Falsiroseomonas tokyonensis TaxID=430521 RepID=A0ABV7BP26_9PROT|nr:hypothetical protein [Falsiroseomonas tokyonensis]MBU8536417.1 hypothetical protein [Falsiroseomonas tokyonensis]
MGGSMVTEDRGAPGVALLTADRFHLGGEATAASWAGARLHAVHEGRSLGQAVLPGATPQPAPLRFRIPLAEPAPAEGTELALAVEAEGGLQVLARRRIATRLAGAIDRCSESLVRGWAANLACPDLPLTVEIWLDGSPVGTAPAQRRRSDLERIGKELAGTGFLFKFPRPLQLPPGQASEVTVRVQGTNIALAHSPWVLSHRFAELPVLGS